MKTLQRCSLPFLLIAAVAFALSASAPTLAEEHADAPAIKLGKDDLGKSREELGDRSVKEKDRAAGHPKKGHDHHAGHGECSKKDCDHKDGDCKKCHRKKGKGKYKVRGYKQCLEKAIRAGLEFDESSRVCRAVFPERKKKDTQE